MIKETPEQARYEIKFVAHEHELPRLLHWVKMHNAGFASPYPDRRINNVYFDTPDCRAFSENLSGASTRRKVRYRWYGDSIQIDAGVLEVKCKRNFFGWKERFKVAARPDPGNARWKDIRGTILTELPLHAQHILKNNPNPVIINQYDRKYFVTRDEQIRLTVDVRQRIWDQRFKPRPNYAFRTSHGSGLVVEVKFDRADQMYASQVIQGIPLRVSRHSKYVLGVSAISRIAYKW